MDRVDFPFLGNTIIMAVVILTHVFFAFFAVGGSTLAVFSEWWGGRKNDNDYLRLAKGLSKFLSDLMKINGVLGVAIVVLTIGLWSKFGAFLYSTQFWPFLIEGAVFLFLMIFSVIYHNTWDSASRGLHIFYGMLTALFAMLAAVFINSIWIFMMVPGKWMETQSRWDAFNTPVLIESTLHMLIPCMINGALFVFVWSFWKARRPGQDQSYYAKVNKFSGAIGASLLFLQPISGLSFLLKVKSATEGLPKPNPWAQLSGGTAQPFLYLMIGFACLAMVGAVIYWVRKHDKGRTALLAAAFCMFAAFFMGAYTREKARKPYLVWNTMGMDQRFTKTMKDKGVGDEPKIAAGAVIDGKQVFQSCKGCHSYKGEGGTIGPDLTIVAQKYANNKEGLKSFISAPPPPASNVMTPFSGSEAELDALADYLLKN
ncbi:MAG: cytochrome ubiquinol oxidase subunit I [Candidatus Electrothrix scaldis]|nr:MAG: cytochrome ubiquinol oxidase subunit I [Candidatus Electrothrix sp. GW3-3]